MKLIVAIDDRRGATTALEFIRHAQYPADTEVHLIHVLVPVFADAKVAGIPDVASQDNAAAERLLAEMKGAIEDNPGFVAHSQIIRGETAEVIAEACKRLSADEVIVPTHARRGFQRLWFGSVADEIADAAPCTAIVLAMPKA